MARYQHVVSGALVEVRDDKVMDSAWKPVSDAKAPAKKAASSSKSEK
jgi:hypothetical protein